MKFLERLAQHISRHKETPEVVVIMRDYEWRAEHTCSSCHLTGWARFIEWVEPRRLRVTTAECPFCGYETEVAREASPEAVDH